MCPKAKVSDAFHRPDDIIVAQFGLCFIHLFIKVGKVY